MAFNRQQHGDHSTDFPAGLKTWQKRCLLKASYISRVTLCLGFVMKYKIKMLYLKLPRVCDSRLTVEGNCFMHSATFRRLLLPLAIVPFWQFRYSPSAKLQVLVSKWFSHPQRYALSERRSSIGRAVSTWTFHWPATRLVFLNYRRHCLARARTRTRRNVTRCWLRFHCPSV